MPRRPVVVGGVAYDSFSSAAEALGVNRTAAVQRLKYGWSLEQAFGFAAPPAERKGSPKGRSITVAGVEYPRLAAAAGALGVKSSTAAMRLERGWSPEEAFGLAPRAATASKQRHTIEVDGVLYDSKAEAARALGVSKGTAYTRLRLQDSPEQAFGLTKRRVARGATKILISGVQYPSVTAAAKAHGISRGAFKGRRRLGWSIEEALGVVARPGYNQPIAGLIYLVRHVATGKGYVGLSRTTLDKRWAGHVAVAQSSERVSPRSLQAAIREFGEHAFSREVVATATTFSELTRFEREWVSKLLTLSPQGFNLTAGGAGALPSGRQVIHLEGRQFSSLIAACRHFSITPRLATQRLKDGWTLEEALERPARPLKPPIEFQGKAYASDAELAHAYGVAPQQYAQRKVMGWRIEQRLGIEPRPDSRKALQHNGVTYSSRASLAKAFGLLPSTLARRLSKGESLEHALRPTSTDRSTWSTNSRTAGSPGLAS